jgi:hypothetical protein
VEWAGGGEREVEVSWAGKEREEEKVWDGFWNFFLTFEILFEFENSNKKPCNGMNATYTKSQFI